MFELELNRLADGEPVRHCNRAPMLVDLTSTLDPKRFIGRAPEQTTAFIETVVNPIRERYRGQLLTNADLKV